MRRILVMGPPGSGKSTLARRLGAERGLPVFHLDQAFWQPGWIETPAGDFRAEVARIAALPAWVIDGNYTASTLEPRFSAADTMVYLDVPSWLCVLRILWRIASSYGRVRADSAPGCPERLDWGFVRYAWEWNRVRRQRNLALARSFPGRTIVLRPPMAARKLARRAGRAI